MANNYSILKVGLFKIPTTLPSNTQRTFAFSSLVDIDTIIVHFMVVPGTMYVPKPCL